MVYFEPYLSVIIPARNEELYLPDAVESVKKQSFRNIEIIVGNAFSTDRTREIAEKLGCKVVDGGRPDVSRNNGAAAASSSSKIFCFLDADARLDSEYALEKALEEMNSRWLDVAGIMQKPIRTGRFFRDIAYKIIYGSANYVMKKEQHSRKPLMQNCMFARREVHEAIGGFKNWEHGEDSYYAWEAVEAGYRFGILESPGKVFISPRRFEKYGLISLSMKNLRFVRRMRKGEMVRQSERDMKGKERYWQDEPPKR